MAVRLAEETSFGRLLRRFRGEARLTQGELAERAGVSVESVRSLESGRRRSPRGDTLRSLADALGLAEPQRALLSTAGRPAAGRVPRELPAGIQDFVGRDDEVSRLVEALRSPGLTTVIGPSGAGKTALVVHAARQLDFPGGAIYATTPRTLAPPAAHQLVVFDNIGVSDSSCDPSTGNGTGAGAPVSTVVISRDPLSGLASDHQFVLGGLPTSDALLLLHRIAGEDRWKDQAATLEVIELCEQLPTALRRAAARLVGRPSWSVADLLGSLIAERRRTAAAGRRTAGAGHHRTAEASRRTAAAG